jgi:hypothetical protein
MSDGRNDKENHLHLLQVYCLAQQKGSELTAKNDRRGSLNFKSRTSFARSRDETKWLKWKSVP